MLRRLGIFCCWKALRYFQESLGTCSPVLPCYCGSLRWDRLSLDYANMGEPIFETSLTISPGCNLVNVFLSHSKSESDLTTSPSSILLLMVNHNSEYLPMPKNDPPEDLSSGLLISYWYFVTVMAGCSTEHFSYSKNGIV
jgi:hypothetical protein